MTEVIVAFLVLVILIGIFSKALQLTGTLMNRADDTLEQYRDLAGVCYLDGEADLTGEAEQSLEQVVLKFRSEKGAAFELPAVRRSYRLPEGRAVCLVEPEESGAAENEPEESGAAKNEPEESGTAKNEPVKHEAAESEAVK